MSSSVPRIHAAELHRRLEAGETINLLDVLPPEVFAASHLPQAVNACVYEVAFPDTIKDLAFDEKLPLVVYGLDQQAAPEAAARLLGMGFTDVCVLRGGKTAWREAGFSLAEDDPAHDGAKDAGILTVDLEKSQLRWFGRNLMSHHEGFAPLRSGEIAFDSGLPACGEFVVDLTKLTCTDLADNNLAKALIGHLQSADFFDTALWPDARFELTGSIPLREQPPSAPNLSIEGSLTLHGVTRPLGFEVIHGEKEGAHVFQGHFDIDRTDWDIRYGSGKFFEALGMHLVSDIISFQLTLVAK